MRPSIALLMLLCCVSVADAQTTFVSGSFMGEIARFGVVESEASRYLGVVDLSLDGEATGFGLSVERSLGERWGVALEFVRPGTMSRSDTYKLPISIAIFPPVPPVEIHREFEQRRLSWNTTAWFSQPLGDHLELAFLGGASFTRTRFRQAQSITVPALALLRPEVIGGIVPSASTVDFGVDPIVGMDARLRVSDHLSLVPGIRLQGAAAGGRRGWLIRPSAGVRWGF